MWRENVAASHRQSHTPEKLMQFAIKYVSIGSHEKSFNLMPVHVCVSVSHGGAGWWRHQDLIAGKVGRERHRAGDQTNPPPHSFDESWDSVSAAFLAYLRTSYFFFTLTCTFAPRSVLRKSFSSTSDGSQNTTKLWHVTCFFLSTCITVDPKT